MSYAVGACGAFGLLISAWTERLGEPGEAILAYQALSDALDEDEDLEHGGDEWYDRFSDTWTAAFLEAFRAIGIEVPDGAVLLYTGHDEERPGRTSTPPDDFVLGFGLYTKPWQYPPMAESFRQAAEWHTWVWGG